MNNVRSTPYTYGGAPLSRSWLDSAATPVRVLFGLIFLAWSWISTVLVLGRILAPVLPGDGIGIGGRYLVAFGLAVLISLAEFVSAGRWPGAYWLTILLADASFTAWQTHTWAVVILSPYGEITMAGQVAAWIGTLVCGVIAAVFGELLLFGKRRR